MDIDKLALEDFHANDDGFVSFTDRTNGFKAGFYAMQELILDEANPDGLNAFLNSTDLKPSDRVKIIETIGEYIDHLNEVISMHREKYLPKD